jgi:SAM-dependent methyltransferase
MDPQYAAAYQALYRRHWWWRTREKILLRKIRPILAGVRRPRMLDVGCGAALLFDALEPFGHIEGIESDPAAVEQSGKWRSRIVVGELDDSYRPTAPFDLILLLDVLEHVRDPDQLLLQAARHLTATGRILVTVPAFQWLWTAHDDLNHHVARYTADELRRVFDRANLVAVETGYMFQSLVLAKLLVRGREALTSRVARVPTIPPAALNSAIQTWFTVEYALAGRLPFGGSVVAIAAPR